MVKTHQLCLTILAWTGLACVNLPAQIASPQLEFPSADWRIVEPGQVGVDPEKLEQASRRALEADGAGMLVRHGLLVHQWGDVKQRFDLKSTSKSIGVTALGLALADGKLELDDRASQYHPSFGIPPSENTKNGWAEQITIRHLATQTAGFAKPGGYEPLLFPPGTAWHYSDGGPNWLAECLTKIYARDMEELLFDRVFNALGISHDDLRWRENQYRDHDFDGIKRREFGSGVHANVDAMARIGLLYLRRGKWMDSQLIPASFVDLVRQVDPRVARVPVFVPSQGSVREYGAASQHYGLLWWNNADGTLANVPRDAYWSWGLYDSLIVVIPSLDIVATRAGKSWQREPDAGHYEVLAPFFDAIIEAVVDRESEPRTSGRWPYPRSELFRDVQWQPAEEIIRLAEGSDNWPITWADDDWMITAYGDGWGFEPKVEQKLSLGLARVSGSPLGNKPLQCENLGSPSIEQLGQGPQGRKASGLLCVRGVLYLLVRNADNGQLAWSDDHGQTWKWCDWKFETSFGCPTFLNAGQDDADAPDECVYIYSPDSETAYDPADRMVLARVPSDKLLDKNAYEYFAGKTGVKAVWASSIDQREAVFEHSGCCYRGGVTYVPALGRYLWCQTLPQSRDTRGPRFEGGFGIYEASHPWGPWKTVFFTEHWDVGPGETSCLPSKWISADGRQACLLFSGNDCFSIRQLRFFLGP